MSTLGPQLFSRLIRNDANATNHNLDYSGANAEWLRLGPNNPGDVLVIHRMIVTYSDVGTMDANKYGNNITVPNGIQLRMSRDPGQSVLYNLTDGFAPVKTNGDWMIYCFDQNHQPYGVGDEYISMRWTFSKTGKPVWLHYSEGHMLELNLRDDFSGLTSHRFLFQGYYHSGGPGWAG